MSSKCFESIVVGTGGFGSSCLYRLARQGVHVLGLDRFPPAHDRGSSHGDTRIIRQAYFEHPDYVPLLKRSYKLWRDLEAESGQALMQLCGLFLSGPPDGEAIAGAKLAAEQHGVDIEHVGAAELADADSRYSGFMIPDGFETVFESVGGYLHVEDCVRTQIELACHAGAVHQSGEAIVSWESDGKVARVRTDQDEYEAPILIITPGAWANELLGSHSSLPKLNVLRKTLHWHAVRSPAFNVDRGGSGFFFEMPEGSFYGFPSLDGQSIKLAEHTGGDAVKDPLQLDRSLRDSDVQPVASFLQEVMPDVDPTPIRHAVCMYTMTPDGHFVVDRHPEFENVFFGAGFSGHGFKFTSVIGEVLVDLAIEGQTDSPVDFLGLSRFQSSGN